MLLKRAIGADHFPTFERSKNLIIVSFGVLSIFILAPLLVMGASIEIVFISYCIPAQIINSLTARFKNVIPNEYTYLHAFVPFVECSKTTLWDKETILKRVIEITSEQLAIQVEEIRNNSHFVHDLGAD